MTVVNKDTFLVGIARAGKVMKRLSIRGRELPEIS